MLLLAGTLSHLAIVANRQRLGQGEEMARKQVLQQALLCRSLNSMIGAVQGCVVLGGDRKGLSLPWMGSDAGVSEGG